MLAELDRLEKAATERDWQASEGMLESPWIVTGPKSQGIVEATGHVGQDDEADAKFIAASRNSLRPMLDLIETMGTALGPLAKLAEDCSPDSPDDHCLYDGAFEGLSLGDARRACAALAAWEQAGGK